MRLGLERCLVVAAVSVLAAATLDAQTPMSKVQLLPAHSLASLSWTSLASDPRGDGLRPRLPDARELSSAIDRKTDLIWFKINVYEPLPEQWFGISIAIDSDGTPDNGMAWWGTNKIKFDRLASAFLFQIEDEWQGYAGVGDSDAIAKGDMTNLTRAVKVAIDRDARAVMIGVPLSALGAAATVRVIATVGSMLANNDDLPNEGMIAVKLRP
jgi:hypothetical protein